jgi:transposase
LFVDEPRWLRPTACYVRLVKELVLRSMGNSASVGASVGESEAAVATAHGFEYLTLTDDAENQVAFPTPTSWNQVASWLTQIDNLRRAA